MLFEQQSYLLRFVISVIKHGLRQTHIEDLLLQSGLFFRQSSLI
ncbi:hypothetical protein QWZ16_08860 [Vibrio ostreicida]|uniref:DUF645 family protein n=1 Tax=Vibrio ostreicida TaxID=526588 RepID=A0ABT8BSR2_9VIBR|nr:hypothetical protein [Vibrio ostreicida]MDN3609807.1 hypothetical protein [Vibrio ostreicida]